VLALLGTCPAFGKPRPAQSSHTGKSYLEDTSFDQSEDGEAFQLLPLNNATTANQQPEQQPEQQISNTLPAQPAQFIYRLPQSSHSGSPHSRSPSTLLLPATAENQPLRSDDVPPTISQRATRINTRIPLEALDSVLEVRSRLESPQIPSLFTIENKKESFELSLRQVMTRSPQSEFSLAFGFSHRDDALPARPPGPPSRSSSNAIFSSPPAPQPNSANSNIRTGTLSFSQNYRRRDPSGQWLVRSRFDLGTELASPPPQQNTDSESISWTGFLERTQALNNNNNLILRLATQLTPSHLSGPHQFKMKTRGFEQFEREARPAEISGDSGVHFHLENQMILAHHQETQRPLLTLVPFMGLGYAWGQGDPNRQSQQFLGQTGIGLSVEPVAGFDIGLNYLANWGDLRPNADTHNVYAMLGYRVRW